jgi:cobalamin biosynthesis Mg chelatase CobN
MKKLLWLAAPLVLALGVMAGGVTGLAASAAPPPAPPGQGDCSHGNTGKECKPDPSTNGKDCEQHGNNGVGGVNEDHCLATTPATTTVDTTTTDDTNTTDDTTTTDATTTNEATTNQTTSTTTTTNKTETSAVTTPTTGTSTLAGSSSGVLSASTPTASKPELQKELAKQAAKVGTGRVSPEHNAPGQLPFTGFSVWILALCGAAMLGVGVGIRRLTA